MNRGEWEGKKEEEGVKTKVALVQKQKELKRDREQSLDKTTIAATTTAPSAVIP